jgi:hypothetical protein
MSRVVRLSRVSCAGRGGGRGGRSPPHGAAGTGSPRTAALCGGGGRGPRRRPRPRSAATGPRRAAGACERTRARLPAAAGRRHEPCRPPGTGRDGAEPGDGCAPGQPRQEAAASTGCGPGYAPVDRTRDADRIAGRGSRPAAELAEPRGPAEPASDRSDGTARAAERGGQARRVTEAGRRRGGPTLAGPRGRGAWPSEAKRSEARPGGTEIPPGRAPRPRCRGPKARGTAPPGRDPPAASRGGGGVLETRRLLDSSGAPGMDARGAARRGKRFAGPHGCGPAFS